MADELDHGEEPNGRFTSWVGQRDSGLRVRGCVEDLHTVNYITIQEWTQVRSRGKHRPRKRPICTSAVLFLGQFAVTADLMLSTLPGGLYRIGACTRQAQYVFLLSPIGLFYY